MKTNKTTILLVEDDLNMGFLLVEFLESNEFEVKLCRDGESGLNAFREGRFDFCILDVMLPGIDGFSLMNRIRAENKKVPIIMLTARSMKQDKLKGFNMGADDYVVKPFDEDELLCRINAVLNRIEVQQSNEEKIFTIGAYQFDYDNLRLKKGEEQRRLTRKENEVLRMLSLSMNNIVKRDDVLNAIWGNNDYFNGRSLDVYIAKLRKYLSQDENVKIESIPTVGYILNG